MENRNSISSSIESDLEQDASTFNSPPPPYVNEAFQAEENADLGNRIVQEPGNYVISAVQDTSTPPQSFTNRPPPSYHLQEHTPTNQNAHHPVDHQSGQVAPNPPRGYELGEMSQPQTNAGASDSLPPAYDSIQRYLQIGYLRQQLSAIYSSATIRSGQQGERNENARIEVGGSQQDQAVQYSASNEGVEIDEPQTPQQLRTNANEHAEQPAQATNGEGRTGENDDDKSCVHAIAIIIIICCCCIIVIIVIVCGIYLCFEKLGGRKTKIFGSLGIVALIVGGSITFSMWKWSNSYSRYYCVGRSVKAEWYLIPMSECPRSAYIIAYMEPSRSQ